MRTRRMAWIGAACLALRVTAAQGELVELRPADMGGVASFGYDVAARGELVLVGAPGQNPLGLAESGAVHVLRPALGGFEQEALLVAEDGAAGDRLGESIAIDGDRALAGAQGKDGGAGAAYVFVRDAGGAWTQEARLDVDGTDGFGRAVALLGDTALVLDPRNDPAPTVHVFRYDGGAWAPEAELVPPGAGPALGTSLALADDTAFVTYFGPSSQFVVYVFARDDAGTAFVGDDTWVLLQELPLDGYALPFSMPLAASGERMVVGRPLFLSALPGAVFVFERDDAGTPGEPLDDVWLQTAELEGSPSFGAEVALDGDRLVVHSRAEVIVSIFHHDGATWELEGELLALPVVSLPYATAVACGADAVFVNDGSDALGPQSGRVRVAQPSGAGGAWTWTKKLYPEGLIRVGCFGGAVAIDGGPSGALVAGGPSGTLVIGAQLAETNGPGSGAAYVFRRDAGEWLQEARLLPSAIASGDRFGAAVAVDGDVALVGAHQRDGAFADQGAAYVFRRLGDAWIEEAVLTAPAPSPFGYFGAAVALDGDVALVGARGADASHAFRFDGASWAFEATLQGIGGAPGDAFGHAVALDQGIALVGAPAADGSRGACYAFRDDGGAWTQEARLEAPGAAPFDRFGAACDVSGARALVGAPRADGPAVDMGAAYAFERAPDGTWSLEQKLVTSTLADWMHDWYGSSVALDGDAALVGAPDGGHGILTPVVDGKAFRLVRTPHDASPWVAAAEYAEALTPFSTQKVGTAVAVDLDAFAIGAPAAEYDLSDWKLLGSVFAGTLAPPLAGEPPSISAVAGGTQVLTLDAPDAEAGRTFVVTGSLSGVEPGFALGPWTLPLNPDAYLAQMLNEPDQVPAGGFVGVLDELGDGAAAVILPPGLALGLQGTTAHHAFAVLDVATGAVTFVSNAAPLAITP